MCVIMYLTRVNECKRSGLSASWKYLSVAVVVVLAVAAVTRRVLADARGV